MRSAGGGTEPSNENEGRGGAGSRGGTAGLSTLAMTGVDREVGAGGGGVERDERSLVAAAELQAASEIANAHANHRPRSATDGDARHTSHT